MESTQILLPLCAPSYVPTLFMEHDCNLLQLLLLILLPSICVVLRKTWSPAQVERADYCENLSNCTILDSFRKNLQTRKTFSSEFQKPKLLHFCNHYTTSYGLLYFHLTINFHTVPPLWSRVLRTPPLAFWPQSSLLFNIQSMERTEQKEIYFVHKIFALSSSITSPPKTNSRMFLWNDFDFVR